LEKANTQLENEAAFLQDSVDELCKEIAPLQVDKVQLFDEYEDLKKDYNFYCCR
jgi:predicted nuclease with TOPRIM domain